MSTNSAQNFEIKSTPTGRVLMIVPQPFFVDRGSPLRVRSTVTTAIEGGYQVDLLVFALGEDIIIDGVKIHRLYRVPFVYDIPIGPSLRKLMLDFLLFFKAAKLVYCGNYKALHGVEEGGVVAALLGWLKGLPYVFDMHSWMSEYLGSTRWKNIPFLIKSLRAIEKFCVSRACVVITVGPEHAKWVAKVSPETLVVPLEDQPIGIEYSATPEDILKLRTVLNLNSEPVALYTGNFEPYQGIDLLLNSWKIFIANYKAANKDLKAMPKLVLVGGVDELNPRIRYYQDLVKRLELTSSVIFAGQHSSSEMTVFMALAAVLVSPRISGANTPLKVYSYMAAGRPIVATRISSHTQVLDDDSAFLANPEPSHFASVLREAFLSGDDLNGQKLLASRINEAKTRVNTRFGREQFRQKVWGIYKKLLSHGHEV